MAQAPQEAEGEAWEDIGLPQGPEEVQKELDKSREKEWAKWKEFSAAIIIDDAQYQELIREGHQVIPTQWVELDKNHNRRLLDPTVEAKYKSRLVVRGDLEKGDPRSNSPTAGIEAQNLVFSFAASRKLRIKSLDVTNAYFQGEEIDRVLLLSQSKGGLPGLKPHQHMLARAPIYGSTDGGRRFWKRLRNYLNVRDYARTASTARCTATQMPMGPYSCSSLHTLTIYCGRVIHHATGSWTIL